MAITRDDVSRSVAAVRSANEEADQLEAESKAARERSAAATKESEAVASQWSRVEQGQRLAQVDELRQLKQRADVAMNEKPDETRPTLDARRYARSLIQRYVLGDTMGTSPVLTDLRWRELHGLQGQVQAFMGRVVDRALDDQADALECRLHRAALTRLRELAGEA